MNSTVSGQVVTVNGSPCTTPCSDTFAAGAQVRLSAPASIAVSSTSRQDFVGWATGIGAPVPGDWVGSLSTASTSITATYRLMNQLTTSSTPSKGGTWRLSPASADGRGRGSPLDQPVLGQCLEVLANRGVRQAELFGQLGRGGFVDPLEPVDDASLRIGQRRHQARLPAFPKSVLDV